VVIVLAVIGGLVVLAFILAAVTCSTTGCD
jgi:hypothetical protein